MSIYSDALREFNEAFNPKVDFLKLILEEFNEWFVELTFDGSPEDELKELCDLLYVCYAYLDRLQSVYNPVIVATQIGSQYVVRDYAEFLLEQDVESLEYLIDSIYTYAKFRHWNVEEAFRRVHESNMSKLGPDGTPVYNESGKVIKGPNYKKPDLQDLVN